MATDINLATYTGNPATNKVDAVRLLIGDTNVPDKARFTDAEIEYFLAQAADDPQKAAQSTMAVSMASVAATAGTRTIGKTTITDNRAQSYKDAAAALVAASPVGGTGMAVQLFDQAHTTPAMFDTGMMDAPGTNLPGNDLTDRPYTDPLNFNP